MQYLVGNGALHAGFSEILVSKAGEDGHGKDRQRLRSLLCCLSRCPQHLGSSRSMNREHGHTQFGRGPYCSGYGVRDVVEFEIEKDLAPGVNQL